MDYSEKRFKPIKYCVQAIGLGQAHTYPEQRPAPRCYKELVFYMTHATFIAFNTVRVLQGQVRSNGE